MRIKERVRIIHHPSTQEIFTCIASMPQWSRLLFQQRPHKPYNDFLKWLINTNFLKEKNERITIKMMAAGFKGDATKVTKWIHAIYDDILELNDEQPQLFQTAGIPVSLTMKYDDNYCYVNSSLPVLPREYESFRFPFVKAKMGIEHFWVKNVSQMIEADTTQITISLYGGELNRFREFALDKALFQGWIHFMDIYQKHPLEIDKELQDLNRHT